MSGSQQCCAQVSNDQIYFLGFYILQQVIQGLPTAHNKYLQSI